MAGDLGKEIRDTSLALAADSRGGAVNTRSAVAGAATTIPNKSKMSCRLIFL